MWHQLEIPVATTKECRPTTLQLPRRPCLRFRANCLGATSLDRHQVEHDAVMCDVVGGRECLSVIFISALRSQKYGCKVHRRSLPLIEPSCTVITRRVFDEIEYVFQ
jgi:hypothetical protein